MNTILKVVCICFLFQMAYGQQYLLTIKSDVQPSATTYEFDVYIEAVGSTFELCSVQLDFTFNTGIANGGTLTFSYVPSSTEFTVTSQVPTSGTISSTQLRLAAPAPPQPASSGQTIPLSPGLKIGRYRITNTLTFAVANANVTWKTSGNPYTKVNYYNGSAAIDITNATWIASSVANPALPVELTSFTATANRLSAQLKWSTATEHNNHGWDIERRSVETANAAWAKVGFVQGAGTSASPKQYSYTDASAAPGRYAYRLKQIDNDGGFKYSESTEVEVGLVAKVLTLSSNYPNPFNPTTTVEFTLAKDGKAILGVYNELGQKVAELFNGETLAGRIIQTHFDASRLASGIYFSRLQADGKSLVKRMMLIK